jgi:hypothetical protein
MQRAADTMAAASGKGGAVGAAEGGASKGGKLLPLGGLGTLGVAAGGALLASGIAAFWKNTWDLALKHSWGAVAKRIGQWMGGIPGILQSGAQGIVESLGQRGGGLLGKIPLFGGGFAWVSGQFRALRASVDKAAAPARNWLTRAGGWLTSGFMAGALNTWHAVMDPWLHGTPGRIRTAVGNLSRTLWNNGLQSVRGLWQAAESIWNGTVRPWLSATGNRIRSAVGNLTRTLFGTGQNVVHGLLLGIRSFMAGIGSWVKGNIVNPLVNAVKHFFGIHSPSTVMHGIGQNLVGGLLRGIIDANPVAVISKVFGSMPAALGHLVEKGLIGFGSLGSRALKALGSVGGFFKNLFGFSGGGSSSANRALAMRMFPWPSSMFGAFDYLEMREAGYSLTARNPSSGAYGMAQFINGPGEYFQYGGNPSTAAGQLIGMFNYIRQRYGNPVAAAAHERSFNWYAGGGPIDEPVVGLGLRSGRGYGFGEAGREYVSSQASMQEVATLLAAIHAELRRAHATAPDKTGAALAKALNSTTRAIAVRG